MAPLCAKRTFLLALALGVLSSNSISASSTDDVMFVAYSAPIVLASGEVFYADPAITELDRPAGRIAIRRFEAELVYENGNPAPLDEIYLHHMSVFTERFIGPCPGTDNDAKTLEVLGSSYFAAGAESRSLGMDVPRPYAWIFQDEAFHATIHVIRTTMVEDVKSCIECHCFDGDTLGGGVECCPHGSRCRMDLSQPGVNDTKAYYLKYSFLYSHVDEENMTLWGEQVVPVETMMFDATDCETEFNVPQCPQLWPASTQCTFTQSQNYTLDEDYLVIGAGPHGHLGVLSTEINVVDVYGQIRGLCTGMPRYGREVGVPGNEKGYIVDMTRCAFNETTAMPIYKGETIVINAVYDSSESHDGVMAYFMVGVVRL